MDVKATFLNVSLKEEIYMDQPIGFVSKGREDKVCHLKRSIYGVKQSARSWHLILHEAITLFGLSMVSEDHSVYVKRTTEGLCFLPYTLVTYYWLRITWR